MTTHDAELLESMMLVRAFEEQNVALAAERKAPGTCTSVGQEAAAVGVVKALEKHDLILTNHRSAGHLLARGAEPGPVLAEIMGRSTGYCKGKSGSLHISAKELGVILLPRSSAASFRSRPASRFRSRCSKAMQSSRVFSATATLGYTPGEVSEGDLAIPLGQAAIRRAGRDVTIVSYSKTVHTCVAAAQQLESMNVAAEVAALAADKAFRALKAPVVRLTGPDSPAPSSHALEQAFMPSAEGIVAAVKRML